MKTATKLICICLAVIIFVVLIPAVYVLRMDDNIKTVETNDIADYGKYIGNYDNETPELFITSFFPDSIESTFSDISYHYKARKFDTYAYECYFEFVIEDTEMFYDFLEEHVDTAKSTQFDFDNSYYLYPISNHLYLQKPANPDGTYAIGSAEIGGILYSSDEHRIVFVALGVYDGGGTDTSDLNYFFSRFNIDPVMYETVYSD